MRIEINLAPRKGKTVQGKGSWSPSAGRFAVVALAAVVALMLAWATHASWRLDVRTGTVESAIVHEVADSLTLAGRLSEFRSLEARRDTIVRRLEIVRRIDGRRSVWPLLLSEISDAMPAHAWVLEIVATERSDSGDLGPGFLLQGRAGSPDGLTELMKNLEGSDYIHGVRLVATEQERLEGRIVHRFSLEVGYREPETIAFSPDTLFPLH